MHTSRPAYENLTVRNRFLIRAATAGRRRDSNAIADPTNPRSAPLQPFEKLPVEGFYFLFLFVSFPFSILFLESISEEFDSRG